jgi:hypothetical protein
MRTWLIVAKALYIIGLFATLILLLSLELRAEEKPQPIRLDVELQRRVTEATMERNMLAAQIEIIRLTACLRAGVKEAECGQLDANSMTVQRKSAQ